MWSKAFLGNLLKACQIMPAKSEDGGELQVFVEMEPGPALLPCVIEAQARWFGTTMSHFPARHKYLMSLMEKAAGRARRLQAHKSTTDTDLEALAVDASPCMSMPQELQRLAEAWLAELSPLAEKCIWALRPGQVFSDVSDPLTQLHSPMKATGKCEEEPAPDYSDERLPRSLRSAKLSLVQQVPVMLELFTSLTLTRQLLCTCVAGL